MTDYTDLRRDIVNLGESFNGVTRAQMKYNDAATADSNSQWEAIAELRDEINAVANRLEALTNFVTTEPAEVAEVARLQRDVSE